MLLGAAGLHMVTQSALAPFYPVLFRSAYGVRELAATGTFLLACQLAAVVALPLWGRAARRVALPRLVTAGQGAAVLLACSLALAPSYPVFTALSVALVAAKAVVLLAYPAIARGHRGGLARGVVQYVMVLHAAAIAATLLGTVVVTVPQPRWALPLLAVAETVLLGACVALLRQRRRTGAAAAAPAAAQSAAPVVARRSALLRPAVLVLVNAVAVYCVRPYFTEYAADGGVPTGVAAVLFLLPHVAVLAVLPAAEGLRRRCGPLLLPLACLPAAAGLAWQAATTEPVALGAARLLFGAGLGLVQVALDIEVLTVAGTGSAYSLIAAAQTCGLLMAPLLATATASVTLATPLLVGAALLGCLAVLAPLTGAVPRDRPPGRAPAASPGGVPAAAER